MGVSDKMLTLDSGKWESQVLELQLKLKLNFIHPCSLLNSCSLQGKLLTSSRRAVVCWVVRQATLVNPHSGPLGQLLARPH